MLGNSEKVWQPRCFYIQDTVIFCPKFHGRNPKKAIVMKAQTADI